MNKLAELQAQLAEHKKKGLAIVGKAEADGDRELTDEEMDELETVQSEIAELQASIAKAERVAEARRTMDAIGDRNGGADDRRPAYGQNTVNDLNPATTFGFKSLTEFAVCVRDATAPGGASFMDPRLKQAAPTNFHTGGGDAGEGFSLPPEYRDSVFEVMEQVDELGPLVDEERTSKRRVEMLANEETPWGSDGVQANWRSEGSQMSASKLDDESRSVVLHEIYAFVLATEELLSDAPRLEGRMTRRVGQALAWKKNQALIYGTGAGQPLGWFNSPALITVAKEGSQAADTIQAENILKMLSRLAVIPGDTPLWITNRNAIPELATMTIGDQPVWLPGNGMAGNPYQGFLAGLPVLFSEHAKTLGDKGDLHLVSPRGYYSIVRDGGPDMQSSIHLYFDYNIKAFRWTTRFGGQPHLSAPINAPTAGGGSNNSKSHFVTLAERA